MEIEYVLLNKDSVERNLINLNQLTFEVTDACNLKCKYCGFGELYEGYDKRDSKKMSSDFAINLLKYLCSLWSSKYSLSYKKNTYISFYGGEPLLNMNLIKKIVSWVNLQNILYCNFSYTMTTNGVLLDKYIDYLVENDFHILVSLDGDEYNNGYRVDKKGKNAFSKVYDNLNQIRSKYPDYFDKRINFNSVLHNRNNHKDLVSYFKEKFDKIPRIAELSKTGISQDKWDDFLRLYKNKEIDINTSENKDELVESIFMDDPGVSRLNTFLYWNSGNVFQSYRDLFLNQQSKKWIPTGTCLPFGKKMFLTVNGKILPCERISHRYSLGEVTEKEVVINIDEIVQKYNEWYKKYIFQCSKCFNNHTCLHCMFNNSNLDNSGKCDDFMSENNFNNYRKHIFRYLSKNPHLYKKIMEEVILH